MPYIDTVDLLAKVKVALEALLLDDTTATPLFDAVAYYNLRDPVKALQELFLTQEQRVAFIVAGGDHYQVNGGGRDSLSIVSHRDVDFELLIGDRVWEKRDPAAVLGGEENIGVIRIKDIVVGALQGKSFGLPGVALIPDVEGGLMDLFDPRNQEQGRTFWGQPFKTYSGAQKVAVG
jgi:hypothetical protein